MTKELNVLQKTEVAFDNIIIKANQFIGEHRQAIRAIRPLLLTFAALTTLGIIDAQAEELFQSIIETGTDPCGGSKTGALVTCPVVELLDGEQVLDTWHVDGATIFPEEVIPNMPITGNDCPDAANNLAALNELSQEQMPPREPAYFEINEKTGTVCMTDLEGATREAPVAEFGQLLVQAAENDSEGIIPAMPVETETPLPELPVEPQPDTPAEPVATEPAAEPAGKDYLLKFLDANWNVCLGSMLAASAVLAAWLGYISLQKNKTI